jgi:hypothetical protein
VLAGAQYVVLRCITQATGCHRNKRMRETGYLGDHIYGTWPWNKDMLVVLWVVACAYARSPTKLFQFQSAVQQPTTNNCQQHPTPRTPGPRPQQQAAGSRSAGLGLGLVPPWALSPESRVGSWLLIPGPRFHSTFQQPTSANTMADVPYSIHQVRRPDFFSF